MKSIKDFVLIILFIFTFMYILIFSLAFVEGLSDSQWDHEYSDCKKPTSIMEHYTGLSKAIEWGCELGKPYEGENEVR